MIACGIIPRAGFSTMGINHAKDIGPNWGDASSVAVNAFSLQPIEISRIHADSACLMREMRLPFAIFAVAKPGRF
jgi:hypothetical protein